MRISRESHGYCRFFRDAFYMGGNTKFAPDRLFLAIGSAYKPADIFTMSDLQTLCTQLVQHSLKRETLC